MEFQEHPLKEGQDIAEKVLCSPREVHFIIDRLEPNLQL